MIILTGFDSLVSPFCKRKYKSTFFLSLVIYILVYWYSYHINHDILLQKLEHYGVRNKVFSWLKSCLSGRKLYVHLNGVDSDTKNITCGVPQGSVLGPLLFLLYINDLPNISNKLKFYLFADDTNILNLMI